jgi:hypothetical protein
MRTDTALIIRSLALLVAHDCFMVCRDLETLVERTRALSLATVKSERRTEASVVLAFGLACSFYPKPVLCLQRSAVLVRLLRAEEIPARMLIGVRKIPFLAHAWVEVNGRIVDDHVAEQGAFFVLEEC